MKRKIAVWAVLVFCCISGLYQNKIYAQSVMPLALSAQADVSEHIITVCIEVPDDATLEAFTIHLQYNKDTCKLYTGNDELPGGYGFAREFQDAYGTQGMLLANDLPGKVIFTGACSQTAEPFHGNLAYVSLLYDGLPADTGIRMAVTALHVNGESVNVKEGQYGEISCEIVQKGTEEQPEKTTVEESADMETSLPDEVIPAATSDAVQPADTEENTEKAADMIQSVPETQIPMTSGYADGIKQPDEDAEQVEDSHPENVTSQADKGHLKSSSVQEEENSAGVIWYLLPCVVVMITMFVIVKRVLSKSSK